VPDARNHYPQIKHHTPPPKRGDNTPYPRFPTRDEEIAGLLPQSPIVCLAIHHRKIQPKDWIPFRFNVCRAPDPDPLQATAIQRIAQVTEPPHTWAGHRSRGAP